MSASSVKYFGSSSEPWALWPPSAQGWKWERALKADEFSISGPNYMSAPKSSRKTSGSRQSILGMTLRTLFTVKSYPHTSHPGARSNSAASNDDSPLIPAHDITQTRVAMRLGGQPKMVGSGDKKKAHQTSRRRIFLVLQYGLHHRPTCRRHLERQHAQRDVGIERTG